MKKVQLRYVLNNFSTTCIMDIPLSVNQKTQPTDLKTSPFLITVNPNLSPKTYSDEYVEGKLKETISCVFNNQSLAHMVHYTHSFTSKYIKNIELEYAIEKGHKRGFVHTHILLKITHKSNLHIKIPEMRDKIRDCLGLPEKKKYFFRIKILKDNNASVRYYIEKDLRKSNVLGT